MSQKIAFLGLGNLGAPIAERLIGSGFELTVWNRTISKAEPLQKLGAKVAENAIDAVEPGGIVFSVLADDHAVETTFSDALLEKLGQNGLHVSMSTISPDCSRKLTETHNKFGVSYVAAPIFARPDAVRSGMGNIVISGEAGARERVKPLVQNFVKGVSISATIREQPM